MGINFNPRSQGFLGVPKKVELKKEEPIKEEKLPKEKPVENNDNKPNNNGQEILGEFLKQQLKLRPTPILLPKEKPITAKEEPEVTTPEVTEPETTTTETKGETKTDSITPGVETTEVTNPDGTKVRTTTTINADGSKVVVEEKLSVVGNVTERTTERYDSNGQFEGKTVEKYSYYNDWLAEGERNIININLRDSSGMPLSEVLCLHQTEVLEYNKDNKLVKSVTKKYDPKKHMQRDSHNSPWFGEYIVGSTLNSVKTIIYDDNGEWINTVNETYNEKGEKTSTKTTTNEKYDVKAIDLDVLENHIDKKLYKKIKNGQNVEHTNENRQLWGSYPADDRDNFRNQMKEVMDILKEDVEWKARNLCKAYGIEFNERVFNSLFNSAVNSTMSDDNFPVSYTQTAFGNRHWTTTSFNPQELIGKCLNNFDQAFTNWVNEHR